MSGIDIARNAELRVWIVRFWSNAVGPGPVETPLLAKGTGGDPHSYAAFVPMGRIGQPDEIADAVVWLLSDEARYVTLHTLPVDGGVCAV
jgi:NAD(P)-dependent dehydrogenase (short-subunit alcohol dehydrogenase family)